MDVDFTYMGTRPVNL